MRMVNEFTSPGRFASRDSSGVSITTANSPSATRPGYEIKKRLDKHRSIRQGTLTLSARYLLRPTGRDLFARSLCFFETVTIPYQ